MISDKLFSSATAVALAATLTVPAATQDLVAVKAGKVLTMAGKDLENAVILIENGRIKQIGKDVEPAWNAKVIDASDKVVMPTWVLAHTSGGLGTANENLANVPYLTVADALDPSSKFFEECRRNGIGTVHVMVGNQTLIGGLGMVVRPFGRTVEDMAVADRTAMKLSLLPTSGSRTAQIRRLRRALEEAEEYRRDYEARKAEFEKEKAAGATEKKEFDEEIDPKKKPVLDLLDGKVPAYLYVPSAAEVPEALRIQSAYKFPVVFVVGARCWRAAALLKRAKQPVILDPELEIWETDPETEKQELVCPAAVLAKAGVSFALSVQASSRGYSGSPARYPWWQAATAVRHGVDRDVALRALTVVPAKILGLEKEIGTIEPGKVANLQILTGDPLAATTWVDTVLLDGEVAYEREKDPRLQYLFGKKDSSTR